MENILLQSHLRKSCGLGKLVLQPEAAFLLQEGNLDAPPLTMWLQPDKPL